MNPTTGAESEQIPTLELAEDQPPTTSPPPLPYESPVRPFAQEAAPTTAAAPLFPADGVIYKVDSSRASLGELRRDAGVGLSILAILVTKLFRARLPGSVNDPNVEKLKALGKRLREADRRGDDAEVAAIVAQREQLHWKHRLEAMHTLRDAGDDQIDAVVADRYIQQEVEEHQRAATRKSATAPASDDDGDEESAAYRRDYRKAYQRFADRVGQLPLGSDGKPSAFDDRFSARSGAITRQGKQLRLEWVNFADAIEGPPALARWLSARGCSNMKYDLTGGVGEEGD